MTTVSNKNNVILNKNLCNWPSAIVLDVAYFNFDENKPYPGTLELFINHRFEFKSESYGKAGSIGMVSESFKDTELECLPELIDSTTVYVVRLADFSEDYFIMPQSNLERLKKYYDKINKKNKKHISSLKEAFKGKVDAILFQLLNDNEFVEMGKNFIDELPLGFYNNAKYLMLVECLLILKPRHLGNLLLLSRISSKNEAKEFFEQKTLDKNTKEEVYSFLDYLEMFSKVIEEALSIKKITLSDYEKPIFITYAFIYQVAIVYLAQKWANEYKQYFDDITELNLDEAIVRYCSIDTIIHQNDVSIGNFIYYLIKHGKFEANNQNYLTCYDVFVPKLNLIMENKRHGNFINRLKKSTNVSSKTYTISDIDLMNGQEFERFIAELFSKLGYECEITKSSGDQGIDVIASKNGSKIGIQAKCYSSTVGNSAIQEVVAGKSHYRLDKAIVVTNNLFTDSAQKLAQSNSIILWDRNILKEKVNEIF